MTTLRPPTRTLDKDGKEILLVPLANTELQARLFPADYERLIAEGWSPNFFFNCNVVKLADWRSSPQRVARLIARPEGDARVGHADRDPLNLRADNLVSRPFVRHRKPRSAA